MSSSFREAYSLDLPRTPRPVVVLGAGGIVRDAHLPAYAKAGFIVAGICDHVVDKAEALAGMYEIGCVTDNVEAAVAAAPADAVYDLAIVPDQYEHVLEHLPDGAPVLLQKPIGNHLSTTHRVLEICRRKKLVAAMNSQLRFAPYVTAARRLIDSGAIGELYDLEVRVQVDTPWHLFPHVLGLDRLEINAHSVHYIDLVRSFLGDPTGVDAVTCRHPAKPVANTRSVVLMHYAGRPLRVSIATNHDHHFGSRYEESFIKWEGTTGAIRAQMGLLLDYPTGGTDRLDLAHEKDDWRPVHFEGSWFPDAFIGSMSVLQRYLEGSLDTLPTGVEDAYRTMLVVEAAYASAARGGVRPDDVSVEAGQGA